VIEKKIKDVRVLLDNISTLYEEKVKKSAFNQIEKLMNILKAKNKSIYIEKAFTPNESYFKSKDAEQHEHQCCHHNRIITENMYQCSEDIS
jgi:hypothetical protein